MKPHGDYKIEVIDNVVHVYPTGGFNEQGIKLMHEDIASIAPLNKRWALFEHPKNIAGLTPESIEELVRCYQHLSKLNCVVAALEISSAWQGVFEKSVIGKVSVPVYLNRDIAKLEQLIKQKLDSV